MSDERKNKTKTPILSSQFPLPFSQLDPFRFEDLALRVLVNYYKLENFQHIGRSGGDNGIDIKGDIQYGTVKVPIAAQVKRHKNLSAKDLLNIFEKFYEKESDFEGEFWVITSANISSKAREKLKGVASGKNIKVQVVDGATLETLIRNNSNILNEFFLPPNSPGRDVVFEKVANMVKRLQSFKERFQFELDRSFAGNFPLISERQRILGNMINETVIELNAEMTIFSMDVSLLEEVKKSALRLISNYRLSNQMDDNGAPFFGKETALKAYSDTEHKKQEFYERCGCLLMYFKKYYPFSF